MGFSQEVREELCQQLPARKADKLALCYGLLLFGKAFSEQEIWFQTECESLSGQLQSLLKELFDLESPLEQQYFAGRRLFSCRLMGEEARRVFVSFGHEPGEISLRIRPGLWEEGSGLVNLLKGAYLACGTIVNPERSYHLEFSLPYHNLSGDLLTLLTVWGFPAKRMKRGGSYVVYCKESEAIEDLLTALGATGSSLKLMRIKVYKDVRNNVNRRANFENANIDKTVNAAVNQQEDIRYLLSRKGEEYLPPKLREVALARLENPELSLRELGEILPVKATRSAVNHRLSQISKLAEELREQEGRGSGDA